MSGILTAPTAVTFVLPGVTTVVTTLPSGFNYASATSAIASLTSVLGAAAATATPTSSSSHKSNLFGYNPSFAVALVAVILYALVTVLLLVRMFQFRAWWFVALILGTIMETLGYGARARNTQDVTNQSLYKMQLSCTILAPIFTAAAEYILLGRLMNYVGARFSLFRPTLVSWVFIISDAISFLIQVAGAAVLLARPDNTTTPAQVQKAANLLQLGDNVLLGGLAVNLASFVVFILQISYFDYQTRKGNAVSGRWRKLLWAIWVSSFLVLVRQIYRVIEFSQGWFGYLPTHEAYFFGLDALPILLASAIYIWYWPNRYFPGDRHLRLAEDGTEWREMTPKQRKEAALEGNGSGSSGEVSVNQPV